jgi:hypothetical protein
MGGRECSGRGIEPRRPVAGAKLRLRDHLFRQGAHGPPNSDPPPVLRQLPTPSSGALHSLFAAASHGRRKPPRVSDNFTQPDAMESTLAPNFAPFFGMVGDGHTVESS